jgi:hypothetical protein
MLLEAMVTFDLIADYGGLGFFMFCLGPFSLLNVGNGKSSFSPVRVG